MGRDDHDVADYVHAKGPHDKIGAPSCLCCDQRVTEGGEEAEDIDRRRDEQGYDLAEAQSLND